MEISGNKLYIFPEKDVYHTFSAVEELPSGFWPKSPSYKVESSKYNDWQLIADVRSYSGRWVLSEDDYPAGKYKYPLGDPDIFTLNFLVLNDGSIADKPVPHVQFGDYMDFIVGETKFYSETIK